MRRPALFIFKVIPMEEKDYMLDEVSGRKRKPIMSILNKGKLSRFEMDELFCDEL